MIRLVSLLRDAEATEFANRIKYIVLDRDAVADEIADLEDGQIKVYAGNYSEYAFEKKQRLLKQQQMYEIQQREIDRLQFSIRRLMSWDAGQSEKFVRRARSMQKRLEKMDKIDCNCTKCEVMEKICRVEDGKGPVWCPTKRRQQF
jgi:ATPase subunit of ABC transporter with duplicated ATPase domains